MEVTAIESWTDIKPFRIPRPKFHLSPVPDAGTNDIKKSASEIVAPSSEEKENKSQPTDQKDAKG